MKKITTNVTYKVPEWNYCNHSKLGKPFKEKCRFCVKQGSSYVCVLHNVVLRSEGNMLVCKDSSCARATITSKNIVEDTMHVDPISIMKIAIKDYSKAYSKLIAEGYQSNMAQQLAQQHVLGGK